MRCTLCVNNQQRFEPDCTLQSAQFLLCVFHLNLACSVPNLPLLVLPPANPDVTFTLLQSEAHCLQPWSAYDRKIAVDMDVLVMHGLVYR